MVLCVVIFQRISGPKDQCLYLDRSAATFFELNGLKVLAIPGEYIL